MRRGENEGVSDHPDASASRPTTPTEPAARLAERYPPRRGRRRLTFAACLLLAAVGLGWLIWAATIGANPAVSGRITAFEVLSTTQTHATLLVQRPDPAVPATCLVVAQATNYERVAELNVDVPSGTEQIVMIDIQLRTFKQATSVWLDRCRPAPR